MLDTLVPDISKTAELVQEITASSNEQSSGADQINRAIQQLDQVIQQNATASEELTSTANGLTGLADQLINTISFFKMDESQRLRKQSRVRALNPKAALRAGKEAGMKDQSYIVKLDDDNDRLDADFDKF